MANVTFTPNHQPAPACYPSDVNGLLDMFTTGGGLSGTIPDTAGGGVFVGSSPPSSALTNKVWFKTDGGGRPLGTYMFYNGNWRKVYTGAVLGEIRLYIGNYNGVFDGSGRGIITGDADGWAVCNGQNGTPNMEGFFPAGAYWDAAGQWRTDISNAGAPAVAAGGSKGPYIIGSRQLPKLTSFAYGSLVGVGTAGNQIYQVANAGQTVVGDWPLLDSSGAPVDGVNQQTLPFPPFFAMGFIMFIGYQ